MVVAVKKTVADGESGSYRRGEKCRGEKKTRGRLRKKKVF